jgi:hypothetical protein
MWSNQAEFSHAYAKFAYLFFAAQFKSFFVQSLRKQQ